MRLRTGLSPREEDDWKPCTSLYETQRIPSGAFYKVTNWSTINI